MVWFGELVPVWIRKSNPQCVAFLVAARRLRTLRLSRLFQLLDLGPDIIERPAAIVFEEREPRVFLGFPILQGRHFSQATPLAIVNAFVAVVSRKAPTSRLITCRWRSRPQHQ